MGKSNDAGKNWIVWKKTIGPKADFIVQNQENYLPRDDTKPHSKEKKLNARQMNEAIHSLEAKCVILDRSLDESVFKKDYITAGKLQLQLQLNHDSLVSFRQKLELELGKEPSKQ